MKLHRITLGTGHVVEIKADDIKFAGDKVYKIVGQNWTPIYKKEEIRGVYVKS